ncbi:sensor histidine kinase [Haloferula sp.]|uniref:sensor histidine kinase n=1 Tax=Haloferula sp. TaxID=2497595 RepID=UPI00329FB157
MTSFRRYSWWFLFGAGLLVAIAGWMWIMVRLVQSETEAADARVRQAEEKLLSAKAEEMTLRLHSLRDDKHTIPSLARSGTYAGWWQPISLEDSPVIDSKRTLISDWRKRIRDKQATAAELKAALENQELQWGWIEAGRDPVASLLLTLYHDGDRSMKLTEMLDERVWNFDVPTVSPAFRLTLIRPLLELQPTDELKRLLESETIRAAEGRKEELDTEYEVIEFRRDGVETPTFWTKSQLLHLLQQPEDYQLSESPPQDRASVAVPGLRRWPYLAAESTLGTSASEAGSKSLIWIGGASGLALVSLALAAVFFGRHQLRLARLRTDLAASVAHELRTPLAGQRLLLETLLENKDQSPEEREEYVAMAFRENKRLGRLAEEFLTFSRLERGVLQLDVEPVEIHEVVDGAVESLREKWEDPDCTLSISIDENLPKMSGDRQALITILRNLLENAWKYSESPREIAVKATPDGGDLLISVSDNGIGLSPRDTQRIFRQFYRVDQRLARTQEGLGLGLSIVKRLLESMEGTIDVTSQAGKGSRFTIRIPQVP